MSIKIYEDANFQGKVLELTASAPDLIGVGFNDVASSVKVLSGTWILYKDVNYSGLAYEIGPGDYNMGDISQHIGNDTLSSVLFVPGKITFFEHAGFQGKELMVMQSAPNFIGAGFNDVTSSVVVHGGTFILYQDVNYQGRNFQVTRGSYDMSVIIDKIGNDTISSVKLL